MIVGEMVMVPTGPFPLAPVSARALTHDKAPRVQALLAIVMMNEVEIVVIFGVVSAVVLF